MSVIDVEALLGEIDADAPCGEDLEYDAAMGELERSATKKEEQQFGDTVIPGDEPDWSEVRTNAIAVLERTHDLRVIPFLARALVHTDGYPGADDALALLRGFMERYWETLHPQLDPEDDNDPTIRINAISSLCDGPTILSAIREAPLVASRALGRFGLREFAVASGEQPPPEDGPAPDMASIEGAFMEVELDELQATADSVDGALEHVNAIDAALTDQVGAGRAPDLSPLTDLFKQAQRIVKERLARRNPDVDEIEPGADGGDLDAAAPVMAAQPARSVAGEVNSREDVVQMLDKACSYYEKHEPSSPVPLLLRRAKKLVYMDFMQIVQDLVPDGYSQVETIRGPEEGEGDDD